MSYRKTSEGLTPRIFPLVRIKDETRTLVSKYGYVA